MPTRSAPDRKFYARRVFLLTFVMSQRVLGGLLESIFVEVESRSRSGAGLHLDGEPF